MSFTLGNGQIAHATLREPHWGAPLADVQLVDDTALVVGSRATLTIADLSRVGTIQPGGAFGGVAGYSWIGGAGKWSSPVGAKSYRDDGGVMLSRVLADLAQDAGELGAVLDGIPDRSLGYAPTRPAGLASEALDALSGGQWWIAVDGTTHVGPRPSTAVSSSTLLVEAFEPAFLRAQVALADDAVAQLLPGAVLTAQGLPGPLTVGSCTIRVDGTTVKVELAGEQALPELLATLIRSLTAGSRLLAPAPYQVTAVAQARATVAPSDARSIAFPEESYLDQVPGVPGMTAVLQTGALVLVAWPCGDLGSPVIVGYPAGTLPATVQLDALTSITLGAASSPALASAPLVNQMLADLWLAVRGLGGTLPSLQDVSCSKAKGE